MQEGGGASSSGASSSGGLAIRAAFQGEAGAYSEAAAVSFFGPAARVAAVPHQTFADAAGSAASGSADCAVIPVENSIEGSVGESCDLLREAPLRAFGEAYHRIEHCLIGHGRVEDVRTVYSHPQALGQCRRFIKDRGWRAVPAYDTAGSAMMVARMGPTRTDAACIASRHAAGVHGVPVIRGGIADSADNHTRFLVLGRAAGGSAGEEGSRPRPEEPLAAALDALRAGRRGAAAPMKTSVIFSVRHEPGALASIVGALGSRGINMAKIESRPTRSAAWEYDFHVDIEADESDGRAAAALEEIRGRALFLKVVGSYPAAGRGGGGGDGNSSGDGGGDGDGARP